MAVEKREGVWVNTELPGQEFASRDLARQAKKYNDQEDAMDTYAENLAATEALDGAEDTEATDLADAAAREFDHVTEPLGGSGPAWTGPREEELATVVERESAKDVRKRENYVTMALYANTETARAYWRALSLANGYELPAEETTV